MISVPLIDSSELISDITTMNVFSKDAEEIVLLEVFEIGPKRKIIKKRLPGRSQGDIKSKNIFFFCEVSEIIYEKTG
ncbi:hypothetical protein TRFO_33510 [Tritrichomonas foetus]|uniref:Uncharacterized protein n=1 Tax=Tritrichomonas foetus TaxID=1144522 RepID=A0A1J4JLI5_9EUKA|nr:hypothetical protein TRFO_33510 [Tritrichomonas foetus]|eukprot:OHS99946.1 hypothetical protein TRFO_33510 [Tritrichomonas foetus]